MALTLTAVQLATTAIRQCKDCLGLCTETETGVFEHITNVCRECLPTGGHNCEYQELHGQQEYFVSGMGRVPCLVAEPQSCTWCHQDLVVSHDQNGLVRGVCIDHQHCCGNCCAAR